MKSEHAPTKSVALGKVFLWFSIVLFIILSLVFAHYLREAFDTSPVQCANDSMMSDVCDHPYRSSAMWTILMACMFGWPVLIVWLAMGITVLRQRKGQKGKRVAKKSGETPPAV